MTAQHATPCRVYIHPALSSKPQAIASIQSRTGMLLIVPGAKSFATAIPAPTNATTDLGPWGGDAA
jgi:hypothetical protein